MNTKLTEDNILALRKYDDRDKPIIKQILENQKIVDELILHYKNSHSSDYDLRSFVEEIIKTARGQDIKELL